MCLDSRPDAQLEGDETDKWLDCREAGGPESGVELDAGPDAGAVLERCDLLRWECYELT